MATLAVAPQNHASTFPTLAAVTLTGCVDGGTVAMAIIGDDTAVTFGATSTSGDTCFARGSPLVTNWGGTNFEIQLLDCLVTASGNFTFAVIGTGITDITNITALQLNEHLTFDNSAAFIDPAFTGTPAASLTTGAATAFILSIFGGTTDVSGAGSGAGGSFTFINVDDNPLFQGGEYSLDAGAAGAKSVDYAGFTGPAKAAVLAGSWIAAAAGSTAKNRRTNTPSGTRTGSRQVRASGLIMPERMPFIRATEMPTIEMR